MLFRHAPSEGRFRFLREVRATLALLLLVLPLMGCPSGSEDSGLMPPGSPGPDPVIDPPTGPAKVINCGWFGNTIPTPSFVGANWAFLETQPFDGQVLYLRTPDLSVNATIGVMKAIPMTYATIMNVLAPVAGRTSATMTDNFALVQGSSPPDFFDDWSIPVQNWANLARACKDSGLKGIVFDNEQYQAPWGDYGSHLKYYSTKSFSQYEAQARLRGKQVMEAAVAQFPEIAVLTLHGPYVSEPDAPPALQFPQWQSGNELLGPFFAGHVEGMGPSSKVVDGGELYSLRTEPEFEASADWRRYDLPSEAVNCTFIPSSLRPLWPNRCTMSFGVYDLPFWGVAMNPTVLRPTLANAIRQSDHYVWFYPEAYTYLLPSGSGGAPSAWVDAIRLGKQDAGQ